mgnify:CR=1 FL=1
MDVWSKPSEALRFLKFLLFSVSAGLIEMGSFALLNEVTSWTYWPCYLIALVLSVLWNFTLNRKFTFRSANNVAKAMLLVFLYYLVFTPASTVLGQWLTDGVKWGGVQHAGLGWNEYLVTAINMGLNFITEFLFQRYVVYGRSVDSAVRK